MDLVDDRDGQERLRRLRTVLGRLAVLLAGHGETHWATWASGCAEAVGLQDPQSFERVTGAYGGMGSLSDIGLRPPSGEFDPDYLPEAEFERLRGEAYGLAAQILADLRAQGAL